MREPNASWLVRAPATRAVLWANAVVFVVGLWLARTPRAAFAVPTRVLYEVGMSDALAVFRELRLETLVTSMFVHASLLHLGFNLYALVQVGPPLERALGTPRTAAVYLVGGIAGALASASVGWLAASPRTSEGFSGAVAAALGAGLFYGIVGAGRSSVLARSMVRWLGLLAILQLAAFALGLRDHLDAAAHGGALGFGSAVGALWGARDAAGTGEHAPSARTSTGRGALIAAAATVLGAFAVLACREARDPFATLGATDRCDLASLLIRAGQCGSGRSALDAAARLLPDEPAVLALEGEWRRSCAPLPGRVSPRS